MKFRLILIVSIALLTGVVALVLLSSLGDRGGGKFDPVMLESASDSKAEQLITGWLTDATGSFEEKVGFLKWLFENRPEDADKVLRQESLRVPELSRQLAQTCFEFLKDKNEAAAIKVLTLGGELFPEDPYIQGVAGVAAYMGGRRQEAYRLLNQAESWQQDIPLVDFYLGGLLAESKTAAERARGKALLVRVAESANPEFNELAALLVISNPNLPLIQSEFQELFQLLEARSAFRADNANLRLEILRVLMQRTLLFYPEAAMQLAELMLQFSGVDAMDRLVFAQIAQQLERPEKAQAFISGLAPGDFPEGTPEASLMEKVQITQQMLDGEFEAGLSSLRAYISENREDTGIQSLFSTILKADMPMSVEEEVLALLLDCPNIEVPFLMAVLQRLTEIDPLRDDQWHSYAADNLLADNPETVGAWLIRNGASEKVIKTLASAESLSADACRIIVEAHLFTSQADAALAALKDFADIIPPAMQAYLASRAHSQKGEKALAYEKWQEAYNAALGSDSFIMMKNLGFQAVELDQPVTALRCLYAAISAGINFNEEQANALLGLSFKYGTLAQSMRIAAYLHENFHDNPDHLNNLAYYKFLAEENMDGFVEQMRTLCDEYSEEARYQLTLAFGLMKIGRQNEAGRLIQNISINWNEAGAREKLIYAVILSATNQRVVAEGLIQNINLDDLIPEEKALLEAI